ncbi:MAG: heavy metal-associated domain-containing protein [Nitrospiria bacterium]
MKIRKIKKMGFLGILVAIAMFLAIYAIQTQAADQKTVLMLGGDYCESYPKELTKALMKVKGVKSVDLSSMPGHVLVVHDDSVVPKTLADVVNGVKGDGWFCTAQIM